MHRFIASVVVRPVTTTMITIAVILFGWVGATRLPIELLPDVSYPTITVRTSLPDGAPVEVEELVTRPIEERLGAVPGVVRAESLSREGESEVILDFAWGTRIDRALADVREKLDRVELPNTASRPIVLRYDPSQEPIMRLALRDEGGTVKFSASDLAVLHHSAEFTVQRELEKLPGVAAVELHGGEQEEVSVDLDPARLSAHGLSAAEVVDALRRDNVNLPGGAISEQSSRFLVRTLHEAHTAADLEAVILRSSGTAHLRLGDIATVKRTPKEREEITFAQGREAIELAIYREGDANIVNVAEAIVRAIDRLPLPKGHEVVVLSDQSRFIRSAIEEVVNNTLSGAALAILVLLFFLRDLRSTLVIAVAIPIALLATFVPLQALDVSLNVMSLGGLALGVGMLVDNSIVVLEAIDRQRDRLRGTDQGLAVAAVRGTSEVAASVVASTLTTVAVFAPMAFIEGVAGQLVRDLSYAVSFSILSSMIVSLTLVPVLQAIEPSRESGPTDPAPTSFVATIITWPLAMVLRIASLGVAGIGRMAHVATLPFTRLYDAIEAQYPVLLNVALRARVAVLLASVATCVIAYQLAQGGGSTLIPELDQSEFYVRIALPRDASIERSSAAVTAMTSAIERSPAVGIHFARAGGATVSGRATTQASSPYLAQLNVRLAEDVVDRTRQSEVLLTQMRAANIEPNATFELGQPTLFSFAPPIEIEVFAEEPGRATAVARELLPELAKVQGLIDIVPDDLEGRPEVRIEFDRERLSRIGLTVDEAALAVQRAMQGEVATTLFTADEQLEVRVRLPRVDRTKVEDVARVQVASIDGVPIRLDAVAKVETATGPAEIRRIDSRRGLKIRARTTEVDLAGVAARVRTVLDAYANPDEGVEIVIGGQAEQMTSSMQSLVFTTVLAVFLVYVVMASSFESLLHPLLILFSVPFALAGVAFACYVTEIPLSAMVGIGVIVLGGIVVNNAIVLIHAVNDRRGAGLDVHTALLEAAKVRIRPILMTTLTTVLGLVPMALGWGDGAALRQPLAVAVIGGLSVSTLLTLIVIPCAYALFPGSVREAWRPMDPVS